MMDTDLAQVRGSLRDGLGVDAILGLGAVLAALCWGATQVLADRPGLALDLVGVDGARAVVGLWVAATVLLVAVGVLAGAPGLRYSPLLWVWGVLVGATLAVDVAVLAGAVGPRLGRTLLWTPWPVVLGLGYLVTGIVATHRVRAAYLAGAGLAGLVVLGAVLFPETVPDWAFLATGVAHAGPLAVDAALDGSAPATVDGYEFREVGAQAAEDGGERR
jgi:hypothetical protein